jgi:MFS family permease
MNLAVRDLGVRRWWALGAVCLAVLAVGVDGTVLSVPLRTLSKALHASEFDLQWFSSGYFLVLAAAMLPAGLWSQDTSPGRARVVREVLDASAVPVLRFPVAASGQQAPDSPYVSSSRT